MVSRVNEIEMMVSRNEMSAAQTFTQMRQLIPNINDRWLANKTQQGIAQSDAVKGGFGLLKVTVEDDGELSLERINPAIVWLDY